MCEARSDIAVSYATCYAVVASSFRWISGATPLPCMHGIYMSRAHHPSLAATSEMRTSDQCDIHLMVIGRMSADNACFFRFATDVFRSLFYCIYYFDSFAMGSDGYAIVWLWI